MVVSWWRRLLRRKYQCSESSRYGRGRKAPVHKGKYRPFLERLEDRLVPAIQLTYTGGTGNPLTLSEVAVAAADDITISELAGNLLRIQLNNGATFAASSTAAAAGLTYQVAGNPALSTFATIDISTANAITTLTANLGDNADTLTFGLTNANGGVGNVTINGEADNDTVNLNTLTITGT